MILYKIEYDFNEDLYKNHLANNVVAQGYEDMTQVFNQLPTHVIASNFFDAVDRVRASSKVNPYLNISAITPKELGINIL